MNKIKAIVFDLGGVVIDFNPKELIENFNGTEFEKKEFFNLMKHPDWLEFDRGIYSKNEMAERVLQRTGISIDRTLLFFSSIKETYSEIEGTKQWLKELKKSGYKLYILSNINIETIEFFNDKFEVFKLFDGGIYSGYEGVVKPEKKIFDLFIDKFKLKTDEFIFLDDSPINVETSISYGWNTYLYNKFNLEIIQNQINTKYNI